MTIEEAKNIFSEYHTGEVIDYDYAIELVAKYCNKKFSIDEEKLDELAKEYGESLFGKINGELPCNTICEYNKARTDFKAGYRKAMEE